MSRPEAPPRSLIVSGVRYLRRHALLARRDPTYEVRFADGHRMRIRPTPARRFQDLTGDALEIPIDLLARLVRPGARVCALGAGTGFLGAVLSRLAGESGQIVTIENDGESVRYARRRYPLPNVAQELGGLALLDGEPPGAFDRVIVARPLALLDDACEEHHVQRLLRMLAPTGLLLAHAEDLAHGHGHAHVVPVEHTPWALARPGVRGQDASGLS